MGSAGTALPLRPAISGEAGRWAGNTRGQLAMRNCPGLAHNGGAVRGGRCVRAANGLTARGEPQMALQ